MVDWAANIRDVYTYFERLPTTGLYDSATRNTNQISYEEAQKTLLAEIANQKSIYDSSQEAYKAAYGTYYDYSGGHANLSEWFGLLPKPVEPVKSGYPVTIPENTTPYINTPLQNITTPQNSVNILPLIALGGLLFLK